MSMTLRGTTKTKGIFIWVAIWIPLSFLFPAHETFPGGGVIAPIVTVLLPLKGVSSDSFGFDFQYVYFPGLIFWAVALALVWLLPSAN